MGRLKKLKKIRIHREGTHILWASFLLLLLINAALYWGIDCKIPFYVVAVASIAVYLLMVNFFRCPIRLFGQDTEKIVVAPADGKIVVIAPDRRRAAVIADHKDGSRKILRRRAVDLLKIIHSRQL